MVYNYAQIWKIAYPILVALIIQQLIGVTDTAFLGRVGEIELGASAIAGVYYIMIFMLGYGFSIGAQIIIARRNGECQLEKIGPLVYQGMSFLGLAALIIIVLNLWYAPDIMRLLLSSDNIYQASLDYLNIRIFGFIFTFLLVMWRAFYIGTINTKVITYNALVMLFANVILDYILIFGKLGFPAMGIQGAALASVISEALALLHFFIYTFFRVDIVRYGLNHLQFWNLKILKEIWLLSSWTTIQSFISIAVWFFFFIAIEHLGERELAISNILRSISSLPYMVAAALGATANSLTGNLIGCGKSNQVMKTATAIIVLGYLAGLSIEAFMWAFPNLTMNIYTDNLQLILDSRNAFYVMLTIYLTTLPGLILFNVVSGTGNTKLSTLMELGAVIVYFANIWLVVIDLRADIAWCWSCEHSYNIVLFLLAYYYLKKDKWCCKPI